MMSKVIVLVACVALAGATRLGEQQTMVQRSLAAPGTIFPSGIPIIEEFDSARDRFQVGNPILQLEKKAGQPKPEDIDPDRGVYMCIKDGENCCPEQDFGERGFGDLQIRLGHCCVPQCTNIEPPTGIADVNIGDFADDGDRALEIAFAAVNAAAGLIPGGSSVTTLATELFNIFSPSDSDAKLRDVLEDLVDQVLAVVDEKIDAAVFDQDVKAIRENLGEIGRALDDFRRGLELGFPEESLVENLQDAEDACNDFSVKIAVDAREPGAVLTGIKQYCEVCPMAYALLMDRKPNLIEAIKAGPLRRTVQDCVIEGPKLVDRVVALRLGKVSRTAQLNFDQHLFTIVDQRSTVFTWDMGSKCDPQVTTSAFSECVDQYTDQLEKETRRTHWRQSSAATATVEKLASDLGITVPPAVPIPAVEQIEYAGERLNGGSIFRPSAETMLKSQMNPFNRGGVRSDVSLHSVRFKFSGFRVVGISQVWEGPGGHKRVQHAGSPASSQSTPANHRLDLSSLDDDEFVKGGIVRLATNVDSVELHTNKNRKLCVPCCIGDSGCNLGGKNFPFAVPRNARFLGFWGATGSRVDWTGPMWSRNTPFLRLGYEGEPFQLGRGQPFLPTPQDILSRTIKTGDRVRLAEIRVQMVGRFVEGIEQVWRGETGGFGVVETNKVPGLGDHRLVIPSNRVVKKLITFTGSKTDGFELHLDNGSKLCAPCCDNGGSCRKGGTKRTTNFSPSAPFFGFWGREASRIDALSPMTLSKV